MIDWSTIITTIVGSSIVGLGGLIVSKINQVIGHVETFATHILECEMRNKTHAEVHKDNKEELNRRLDHLEHLAHKKHEGGA